jgi:hypothetical protein
MPLNSIRAWSQTPFKNMFEFLMAPLLCFVLSLFFDLEYEGNIFSETSVNIYQTAYIRILQNYMFV